VKRASCLTTAH